ncbi:hypothetical protein FQR65_LT09217 [Abscondita terminalis]|nr:hypothetical protein FQR65_LT09217 [Abscondita terminalis]
MPQLLSPFVYWAQSEDNLFIKVDLKDVKNPEITLEDWKLQFEAKGVGAHGNNNYGFSMGFYSDINCDASTWKVLDSKIDFNIVKSKKSWWPRLTSKPQKPGWLKIDFDRWQSEDDVNSEEERVRDIRDDYEDLYQKLQKEEFGYSKEDIKQVYLIIYNLLMFVGFMYVVSVLGVRFLRDGADFYPNAYEVLGSMIRYLHVLQFSEVIMLLIGWKPGAFLPSILQIGGRLMIIYLLIDPEPRLQVDANIFFLYFVWSAVEIIRYPYYVMQVCKINVSFLTWLRYTVWIFLYPLGLYFEGTLLYKSIPFLDETKRFSVSMPNTYNISFSLVTQIISFGAVWVLFFSFYTNICLLQTPKPGWLKIDFDRWQSEDDVNSEEERVRDIRDDYEDLYQKLQKEEFGYSKEDIKQVYLIIYNLLMFVGFMYVVSVLGVRFLRDGADFYPNAYEVLGSMIRYLHVLQFSEVIMLLIGWKPGAFLPSILQIGGRLMIIYLLIDPEPRLQVDAIISCTEYVVES